jgi:hypothetical protein
MDPQYPHVCSRSLPFSDESVAKVIKVLAPPLEVRFCVGTPTYFSREQAIHSADIPTINSMTLEGHDRSCLFDEHAPFLTEHTQF